MKILTLYLSGLNSLRAPVSLDFSSGNLGQAGLFAITGPTGAGKSTILDAISLSLYNATARKQGHEIVSRGEREAKAEVEFEVRGTLYRSVWSIRLTKDRSTGAFKKSSPQMELSTIDELGGEGELLCTGLKKQSGVPARVEQITGLDFKRFQQSMLLAQGQFDAFLMASDDDRSALLEQITGSEIYSEVSRMVYNEHASLSKALATKREVLSKLGLPDPAEEEGWRVEHVEIATALPLLQGKSAELSKQIEKHVEYVKLQRADLELTQALAQFDASKTQRETLHQRRRLHDRALPLLPEVKKVKDLVERKKALSSALESLEKEKGRLAKEGPAKEQHARETKAAFVKANEVYTHAQVAAAEIKTLADNINKEQHELDTFALNLKKLRGKSNETAAKQEEASARQTEVRHKLKALIQTVSTTAFLDSLGQAFERIKEGHEQYRSALQHHEGVLGQKASLSKDVLAKAEQLKQLESRLPKLANEILQGEASSDLALIKLDDKLHRISTENEGLRQFGASLKEHLIKKEQLSQKKEKFQALEKELLVQLEEKDQLEAKQKEETLKLEKHVADLKLSTQALQALTTLADIRSVHIHLLKPGQACPLCGALEHPAGYDHEEVDLGEHRRRIVETEKQIEITQNQLHTRKQKVEAVSLAIRQNQLSIQAHHFKELEKDLEEGLVELQAEFGSSFIEELKNPSKQTLDLLRSKYVTGQAEHKNLQADRDKLTAFQLASSSAAKEIEEYKAVVKELGKRNEVLAAEVKKLQVAVTASKTKLLAVTKPFEIPEAEVTGASFISNTKDAMRLREKNKIEIKNLEEKDSSLTHLLAQLKSVSEELEEEINLVAKNIDNSKKQLHELVRLKSEKLGGYTTLEAMLDARKKHLSKAVDLRETAVESVQKHKEKSTQLLTRFEEATQQSLSTASDLEDASEKVTSALKEAGFETMNEVLSAILSQVEKERLDAEIEASAKTQVELRTRRSDLDERLSVTKEQLKFSKSLEQLEADHKLLNEEISNKQQRLGSLSAKLSQVENEKQRVAKETKAIKKQEEELLKWSTLNQLIGSANGKKFRQFAQGITLQQLLSYANYYLGEFYPRFSVSPNPDSDNKPLEILICDHYEADQIRPVSTASGGERFLVSMALALGFSRMASRNISIDTLFIDEGFGSLDGETLDKAITALERLQQSGKTIGIISHVAALQERIATQIRLTRLSSGRSTVEIIA